MHSGLAVLVSIFEQANAIRRRTGIRRDESGYGSRSPALAVAIDGDASWRDNLGLGCNSLKNQP